MATILPPTPTALPRAGASPAWRRHLPGRARLTRAPAAARSLAGYWPGTWKAAVALIGLLVVRLPEMYLPIVKFRPSIVTGSIIGVLLAQRVGPRAWRAVFKHPAVRWLAFYLATFVITIPFALWPGGAFNVLYLLPFVGLMFVTIMLCQPTRETLDRILRWTIVLASIYAVYIIMFGAIVMDGLGGARLGGSGTYDPNDLAVMMVIVLQLSIGLTLRERGLWRLIAMCGAVLSLIVTLKTGSRGGIVALVMGTFMLLLAQKPARFFALSTAIVIAIPLAWMYGPESFRVRTASFLDIGNDYTFQTDAGRWVIWKRGLGYFARRPIIGVGAGGYQLREGEYFASQGRGGAWLTAHNTYLQVLVEEGILGGIALAGMIVVGVRGALPLWRRPPPRAPNRLYRPEVLAALTAFLSGALFLSHAYNPLLFFSFAIAAFAGQVYQKEQATGAGAVPLRAPRGATTRVVAPPAMQRVAGGRPTV